MRYRIQIASQENCCLRSEMRTPISAAAEMGAFCFSASDARGVSPFTGNQKLKISFCGTLRDPLTPDTQSCSGRRLPSVLNKGIGCNSRTCAGSGRSGLVAVIAERPLVRAMRGFRKKVIGTAVMAGREGRGCALAAA